MSEMKNIYATAAKKIIIVKAAPYTQELMWQSFKGQH